MGREHAVARDGSTGPALAGYVRLVDGSGGVVRHAPGLAGRGREVLASLGAGLAALPDLLGLSGPELEALVVAEEDWARAPRDSARPYPWGLPYFTRATEPPALMIPARFSNAIRPQTPQTLSLVVYHELAHAFLAGNTATRTPVWLRELPPQAVSAALALRWGLPLGDHLSRIRELRRLQRPGFTVRGFRTPAGAEEQMAFQNLLLELGASALEDFGEGFLRRLVGALRTEREPGEVSESQAEALLAAALGPGGREWLFSRRDF